jgi:hypothetical protein
MAGWLPSFRRVLGDARPRDLKAKLELFALDARRAPKRNFDADPPNRQAQPGCRSAVGLLKIGTANARSSETLCPHDRLERVDGEDRQDLMETTDAAGRRTRSYAGATDGEWLPSRSQPTTSIGDTDGSPSSEQPSARRSP